MLDITALKKACSQLETSLQYCRGDLASNDNEIFRQFRAAAIQAFEYTYELSTKMIKRQLKDMESFDNLNTHPFRDILRLAAIHGLISDPQVWFEFRDLRNISAHTYDEDKAERLYLELPGFQQEVAALLKQLEKIN